MLPEIALADRIVVQRLGSRSFLRATVLPKYLVR